MQDGPAQSLGEVIPRAQELREVTCIRNTPLGPSARWRIWGKAPGIWGKASGFWGKASGKAFVVVSMVQESKQNKIDTAIRVCKVFFEFGCIIGPLL